MRIVAPLFSARLSRQAPTKRRRQAGLLVFLDQPGDVVEAVAGAFGLRRQTVDLRDDAPRSLVFQSKECHRPSIRDVCGWGCVPSLTLPRPTKAPTPSPEATDYRDCRRKQRDGPE